MFTLRPPRVILALPAVLWALVPGTALGLEVGDPAPAIKTTRSWNAAEATAQDASDKVQVVSFWASWSAPAVASLETLAELQKEFAGQGVRFVAISKEAVDVISKFVDGPKNVRGLRLSADDQARSTDAWMTACGENAVPHAFVVNADGIIVWRGHPAGLRDVVESVVQGTWVIQPPAPPPPEPETIVENDVDPSTTETAPIETAEAGDNDNDNHVATSPDDDAVLPGLQELQRMLGSAEQSGEWDQAVALIDAMLAQLDDPEITANLLGRKFNHQYERMDSYSEAQRTARRLLDLEVDEPGVLNSVAWTLLARGDFESLEYRWPEIAHEAARRALRACNYENTSIIDTYARSLYMLGHVEHAVTWQDRAVQRMRDMIEEARAEGGNRRSLRRSQSSLRGLEVTLEYYREVLAVRRASEQ